MSKLEQPLLAKGMERDTVSHPTALELATASPNFDSGSKTSKFEREIIDLSEVLVAHFSTDHSTSDRLLRFP